MADEIPMMASHEQANAPFSDFETLHQLVKAGDPRGLAAAKNLTPEEQQAYFDFQMHANKGRDATSNRKDSDMFSVGGVGVAPETALGGGLALGKGFGAAGGALKYAPKLPVAARAAGGTVAGYATYRGLETAGNALGLPPWLVDVVALGGSHHVGGKVMGGGSSEAPGAATPPRSMDVEDRVSGVPLSDLRAKGVGDPAIGVGMRSQGQQHGPAEFPSNMTRERGGANGEGAFKGVQNDFKGTVSLKQPKSSSAPAVASTPGTGKSAKFDETSSGADQLEKLLDAIHGPDRGNAPNGGLKRSDMPSNISFHRSNDDLAERVTGTHGNGSGLRVPGVSPANKENPFAHSHDINPDYAPEYTDASVEAAQKRIAAKLDEAMKRHHAGKK